MKKYKITINKYNIKLYRIYIYCNFCKEICDTFNYTYKNNKYHKFQYTYYEKNKIHTIDYYIKGKLNNYSYTYYMSGNLMIKRYYMNNLLNNFEYRYYDNISNSLLYKRNYVNDLQQGLEIYYNENSTISCLNNYVNNKLYGNSFYFYKISFVRLKKLNKVGSS